MSHSCYNYSLPQQSEQDLVIPGLGAQYEVTFPVPEFLTGFDLSGTFLNAAAQLFLVDP